MTAPERLLAIEFAMDRARVAARAGKLDEALALLDSERGAQTPASLDLLARIHAQRGEYADADACWSRIPAGDSHHAAALAGRKTIAALAAGRLRFRPLLRPAGVAALAAVLAVPIAGVVVASWPRPPQTSTPLPTPVVGGTATPGPEELARQQEMARRSALLDALAGDLTGPGVRAARRGEAVQVVFDQALFSQNTVLKPQGRAALMAVGRRLAGRDVAVTVVGHVVPVAGGRTSGGSTVAWDRAQAAAAVLAEATGWPLTDFVLISGDQSEGPHPGQADRNRTVTLLVTPA